MTSEKPSWKKFRRLRFSSKKASLHIKNIEENTVRHAHRFVALRFDHLIAVRRHIASWVLLVLLIIGVSVGQWLLFKNAYMKPAFVAGGNYSEGVLGPLETLNPVYARSSAEKSAARLLFSSLYNYDETGHLKGNLAHDIKSNEAETEYTVTLDKGAKWSDGTAITAKDVLFTTKILADPLAGAEIVGWKDITVKAKNDTTVTFTLKAPYAPFIHALTFPILPEHVLKDVKPSQLREVAFSQQPTVTSGPFTVRLAQDITVDGTKKIVHMAANPYYIGGAPKLERFQLYVYPSRDDLVKGLKTNEIIATPELAYAALPDDIKKRYVVESAPVDNGVYALFNNNSDLLKSPKIRQALAQALDVNAVRKELQQKTSPLTGPLLDEMTTPEFAASPSYDVKNAQKVFDEEGWKIEGSARRKSGQPFQLTIVALKGSEFGTIADNIARQWRENLHIGIEVRMIDPADVAQNVLQSVLRPRNFDVLIYEFAIGGDADVFSYWHSSQATENGLNFANYNDIIADEALSSARTKMSEKIRTERYKSFVRRWQADVPAIALYRPHMEYIHSRDVNALRAGAVVVAPADRYADVLYWAVRQETVYKTP